MSNIIYMLVFSGCVIGIVAFIVMKFKPGKKTRVKDLYSEGLDMMVLGQLQSAYNCFKTIIQDDTDNISAYLKLGQVVREGNNTKQALKIHKSLTLRKQLSLYEKLELHKNLSLDYFALNFFDKSINESEKILDLDKINEWALEHLIKVYKHLNKWGKSIEYLIRLHKVKDIDNPGEIGYHKMQEGRELLKLNEFSHSRELFEEALNIDDGLYKTYLYIGNSYAKESDNIYTESQKFNPIDTNDLSDKAKYNEHFSKARNLLSKAITMWVQYIKYSTVDSGKIINSIKDALYALNRFDELEKILKKIIETHPENIHALTYLADFYDHKGENQNAFDLLEIAKEKSPNSIFVKAMYIKLKLKKESLTDLSIKMDTLIQKISNL